MSECTCPHQDPREPDHDWDCPACPRFDRYKTQQLIRKARTAYAGLPGTFTEKLIADLAEQLDAARRTIDRVPTDQLAQAMAPRVRDGQGR